MKSIHENLNDLIPDFEKLHSEVESEINDLSSGLFEEFEEKIRLMKQGEWRDLNALVFF